MRRTMASALALICIFAPAASGADMLGSTTWTQTWMEDFTAYDPPPAGKTSFIDQLLGGANCSFPTWMIKLKRMERITVMRR